MYFTLVQTKESQVTQVTPLFIFSQEARAQKWGVFEYLTLALFHCAVLSLQTWRDQISTLHMKNNLATLHATVTHLLDNRKWNNMTAPPLSDEMRTKESLQFLLVHFTACLFFFVSTFSMELASRVQLSHIGNTCWARTPRVVL